MNLKQDKFNYKDFTVTISKMEAAGVSDRRDAYTEYRAERKPVYNVQTKEYCPHLVYWQTIPAWWGISDEDILPRFFEKLEFFAHKATTKNVKETL